MVNHFNNSLGGEYENSILNNLVKKDSNFNSFKKAVAYKIFIKLKSVNWDLNEIKENDLVRFDNVAFNSNANHDDGLTILIDAVEHIEVFISEFKSESDGKIHMKLKYVLYDTFGLDLEDLKKFGKRNNNKGNRYLLDWDEGNSTKRIYIQNNYGLGFSSWWILQHKYNCKPFITKVSIIDEVDFNKKTIYTSPKDENKNSANDTDYGKTGR